MGTLVLRIARRREWLRNVTPLMSSFSLIFLEENYPIPLTVVIYGLIFLQTSIFALAARPVSIYRYASYTDGVFLVILGALVTQMFNLIRYTLTERQTVAEKRGEMNIQISKIGHIEEQIETLEKKVDENFRELSRLIVSSSQERNRRNGG